MIVVRYGGGIGNQLYQYAIQVVLQHVYPEIEVKADPSFYYLLNDHNGFEIQRWINPEIKIASTNEIESFCCAVVGKPWMKNIPDGMRRWLAFHAGRVEEVREKIMGSKKRGHLICERDGYIYQDLLFHLNAKEDWYIQGLWQNWNYFKNFKNVLMDNIRFQIPYREEEKQIKKKIESTCSVGIHIRRGDFIGSSLDICGPEYYKFSMNEIKKRLHEENIHWFFFTDDKEFVQNEYRYIKNKDIISHEKQNSIYDMMLMSECRNIILSNSTFAFWSGILNQHKDKVVVAPLYANITWKGKYRLTVPEDWIQIDQTELFCSK